MTNNINGGGMSIFKINNQIKMMFFDYNIGLSGLLCNFLG